MTAERSPKPALFQIYIYAPNIYIYILHLWSFNVFQPHLASFSFVRPWVKYTSTVMKMKDCHGHIGWFEGVFPSAEVVLVSKPSVFTQSFDPAFGT